MGRDMIEQHNRQLAASKKKSRSTTLDSPFSETSSSSFDEKVTPLEHFSPEAKPVRHKLGQEQVKFAEKKHQQQWVMGNIKPSKAKAPQDDLQAVNPKTPVRDQITQPHNATPVTRSDTAQQEERAIDDKVLQRMMAQRHAANTVNIRQAIQPRRSSKSAHKISSSKSTPIPTGLAATEESTELVHVSKKPTLHQPVAQRWPSGSLALVPPPLEGPFRHPFAEPIPTPMPQRLHSVPSLSCDPYSNVLDEDEDHQLLSSSPLELSLEEVDPVAPLTISRPSSGASNRFRGPSARRSMDAGSVRSLRSDNMDTSIDVKSLATKAVKEGREKRGWKDEVNKAAMQRCLLQKENENLRRLSAASLGPNLHPSAPGMTAAGGMNKALHRVRTQDARVDRRGSSPALPKMASSHSMYTTHTSPRRAVSPLHLSR